MTDLTDKWKKGELPDGWYWVEGIRAEGIYAYTAEYLNNMYRPRNGERIIEQVPSYEEWKRILHYAGKYEVEYTSCVMDYENLKEENTKLKELLKECRGLFNRSTVDGEEPNNGELIIILTKIDEALR